MKENKETFDTWNNIASLYQEKFMDLSLYNESYNYICNSIIIQGAKLLDVGCGPGNITKYLLSKRSDYKIFGIDIAPNMIQLAKANNPTADFLVMDSRHINQLETKFDGIVCGFCLPYLSGAECKQLISDSYNLLNDNGLIYLSFVEGNPDESGFKSGSGGRVYFQFHSLETLTNQLTKANFDQIKIFKVPYQISETQFDTHTILTARKNAL